METGREGFQKMEKILQAVADCSRLKKLGRNKRTDWLEG